MLRLLAWATSGVLAAGCVYNVALALGAGTVSVRRGDDPLGVFPVHAGYAGVAFAFAVGVFTFFKSRVGAALTALAIPIVAIATTAYIGH